ncbi:MAG TPA: TonB-dependent receptor [Myxococcota bacterium]|nr:TonB-dependent receptor [Myxococcota bacterium]
MSAPSRLVSFIPATSISALVISRSRTLRFKRASFVGVALCALLGAALPAIAASEEDEEGEESDVLQVGDVVATATRTDTPAAEVASSVTVVTAAEIERRQLKLVTEVLRTVPGVDVRRNGGPGTQTSIFMRGGDSDHVLVLLDGVELNDPASPNRAAILNDLTTEDIERIEIVRGPQSVLYGGDAMSGVIQIFTKRGSGKPKVVASGEGGSYATADGVLSVSGATEQLSYAASGSYWTTDGFSSRSSGNERDGYWNGTASARAGWKPSDALSFDGTFRYSDAQVEFDGSPAAESDRHIDSEQLLARFAPRLSLFDGRWVQTLSGQFSRTVRDTQEPPFFPAGAPSTHTQIDGSLYAIEWQNDVRIADWNRLTVGLERQWEEADFAAFDFATLRFVSFDGDRRNFAVYVQDQVTWGERLFGTLGLRFDDSSDFDSEWTGRFTIGTSVPEIHTIFRGSIGRGFKAPSLQELNPVAFGGTPNLEPEESLGADLGFETSLCDDRFEATATFFYNDVDNLIIAVFDDVTFESVNVNIDRSKAYGVEAGVELEIVDDLRFGGNYTYTHTEAKGNPAAFGISNGSRLLRRPTHKASLDLIWGFLDDRAQLAATLLYIGDRRDLSPVTFSPTTAEDYVTLNLTGRFKVSDWLEIFARADNVLDEDYEDVLGFGTAGASGYGGIRLTY